jgi:hypothetical protein
VLYHDTMRWNVADDSVPAVEERNGLSMPLGDRLIECSQLCDVAIPRGRVFKDNAIRLRPDGKNGSFCRKMFASLEGTQWDYKNGNIN